MLASGNNHFECVNLLIKNRANVDIVNIECKSALMLASENCHANCIKLLQ